MSYIEISSLPRVVFSHCYEAETYINIMTKSDTFVEIAYLTEGEGNVQIGDEILCAQKGDVICFLHNKPSSFSASGFHSHATVAMEIMWNFTLDQQNGLFIPPITPAKNNTASICRIIDDFTNNEIFYKDSKSKGAAKILELLCAIDKCNRQSQSITLPSEVLYTNRAKEYISKNIHYNITQGAIAEYLKISPEYLCAVFKKTEGTTIMKYINRLKLENIKTLIDHKSVRLYEAAAMYGYTDPNYVSRLYKQLFGRNITDKASR